MSTSGKVMAAALLVIELLVTHISVASAVSRHPLSIDDILKMEDVGRAVLTSDGRSLVYEWIVPYETAPNRETLFSIADDRSALAKLYVSDLDRSAKSRPLFEQDTRGGYWLGGLSPDGARLSVYMLVDGKVSAGVYDFASGRLRKFEFTPDYSQVVQKPVWISNDELVYSALPIGSQPAIVGRSGLVARLNELWRRSFVGMEPSATVITSTPRGIEERAASTRGGGKLVRVNARTGSLIQMGEGHFYNLRVSPNWRYLAGLRGGPSVQPEPDGPIAGDGLSAAKQLVIFDLEANSKQIEPCLGCDIVLGSVRWSAGGQSLTFLARNVGESVKRAELFHYTPASDSLKKVTTASLRFACGTTVASQLRAIGVGEGDVAVLGRIAGLAERELRLSRSNCEREDWFLFNSAGELKNLTSTFSNVSRHLIGIAEDALFVLADGDVWRLQSDGIRRNLTLGVSAPLVPSRFQTEVAKRSDEMFYMGDAIPTTRSVLQAPQQIVVLDLKTGHHKVIDKPNGQVELLDISQSGEMAVFRQNSSRGSTLLLARRRGPSIPILELNVHLREIAEARQVEITYDAPSGAKLSSCLLLPPDWTPVRRYPLIVHVYPYTQGECFFSALTKVNPFSLELLASQEFIVLFAAAPRSLIRTPDGPSRELTSVVLAAVDRAVQSGYADPDRLGLYGLSQGHHSALQVVTETDRFKAAVVMYGISDFSSHYGTNSLRSRLGLDNLSTVGNAVRYENTESANWLGATPWEDPERYYRNSPVFYAHRIRAPLLIMHSDFDIFPLGQSEEIFSALYRMRKEAVYVTYWGEGHGNLSPANIRDMWQRIFRWFGEHLGVATIANGDNQRLLDDHRSVAEHPTPPVLRSTTLRIQ